jgi:putative ABC transport system permease protein
VIGIVTVTVMATAINGVHASFLKSISTLNTDVLYATRIDWMVESHEQWMKVSRRPRITWDQVRRVAREMSLAQAVAPFVQTQRAVEYEGRTSSSVTVIGTSDQYQFTGASTVAEGRFFSAEESDGGRPVCVVGNMVATNLFIHEPALGKRVKVGGRAYQVVGVLQKEGQVFGTFSLDNQVLIPVRQFTSEFWRNPDFQIHVKVGDLALLDDAYEELRGVLRKVRHVAPGDDDNFAVERQESILKVINRVTSVMASVGFFITGLSLFVGGIGIMNIMYVSVAERTREIGIRKAIGAKRRAILVQFLLEAACICLLGGLIALGISWPITLLLGRVMPASMSLPIVAVALLVSGLTGVLSGFFPAWRAARMDPVEALRNE